MKSSFGGSFKPFDPFPAPPRTPHHGILHNLLSDAVNTAKGIPFGTVQMVEHPIKSLKLMGKSYEDTYGHGWGHFEASFMAHPLQPLLDAISVPLLLAGGAGAAVKGASFAAELGKGAEAADILAQSSKLAAAGKFAEADSLRATAMNKPRLDALAQHFRKGTSATTRMAPVESLGGSVSLPYAYSSNLFRRFLTKGSQALMEKTSKTGYFSKEHLGERLLSKEMSKRAAATTAKAKGQAAVLVGAKAAHEAGKAGFEPQMAADVLAKDVRHGLEENALPVPLSKAQALVASPGFKDHFELLYTEPQAKVKPGEMVNRDALPPGNLGVAEGTPKLASYEHDSMMNLITTLGSSIKTGQELKHAYIKDGNVLVVRKGIKEAQIRDMEQSAKLANYVYKGALGAWKGFILGLSPRYFVNNVIGNAGMYAAATNPVEFTRGVIDAVKQVRGNRAAARLAREQEFTLDSLMKKWLPDDFIHSRAGYLQHGALGVERTAGMRLRSLIKRAAHARLYAVTEQVAYRGPQRASIMGALHTDSDFRNLYRSNLKKGMDRTEAYQRAANTIWSDPRKAAAFEKRVADWAGQYYHLNSLEQKLTAFVPFYTWDRHALRFGKEQVLSRPVRSVVLAQLGALGDKEADKELGKIPDFMKGAVPVSGHGSGILGLLLGQNIAGRKKILLTSGYNPLAAAADDTAAIAVLFGQGPKSAREAIGGQLNPVITGALAGITGQNLFTGATADTHGLGPVGGIMEEAGAQLPQYKLVNQLVKQKILGEKPPKTTTRKGAPKLYTHSMRQTISSLLGLNERDFSPVAARKLADEQYVSTLTRSQKKKRKEYRAASRKARRAARNDLSGLKSSLKTNF